jgi:transcriptional regulator with XRE-family HTH domain
LFLNRSLKIDVLLYSFFLRICSHWNIIRKGVCMSIVHLPSHVVGTEHEVHVPAAIPPRPLQRLAAVRQQQGISRRTVARRLNVDIATVREQEDESTDISLTQLYQWQQALEVPVSELLIEGDDSLSAPIMQRAQLLRLMKSALTIHENTKQETIRRMAQTLIDQLLEIMPELAGVGPWHTVGQRRRLNELGVAADRRLSDDVFLDLTD